MANPDDILDYWLNTIGPKGWYAVDEKVDAQIRDRFLDDWEKALAGGHVKWTTSPRGTLAFIILTDQFPRNMFRGDGKSFASDAIALAAAKQAISRGDDMKVDEPERQFFYMPLMHSECLVDQDRCVRLMKTRMPKGGAHNLRHARAHREVIRQFGRFPYRNDALGRSTTAPEAAFMGQGGYAHALEQVDA